MGHWDALELRKTGPNWKTWVTEMHWELGKVGPN